MVSRRRFLEASGASIVALGVAGCGSLGGGGGEDANAGATGSATTAFDRRGPGPEYGGVEADSEPPAPSDVGAAPLGEAVAWSVPVGRPVTARPVVAGDVIFLGAGEHESDERPRGEGGGEGDGESEGEAVDELRPRYPGFVHAVGLDGTREFSYAAPAPVLDVAPVPGDDASAGSLVATRGA